ncbi:MAG: flagella basal body P-ring formation protein FlgA [Mycobacterium sp.]|nr:flagella basal body P-ring formation protein FlgA [Mycobacterium sp.]
MIGVRAGAGEPDLNPTAWDRLRHRLQPDWVHLARTRRLAAGALVLLSAAAALRPDPVGDTVPVLVAARDLPPGVAVTQDDIRVEARRADSVPAGVLTEPDGVLGATPGTAIRRGEILTDVRLVGSRLAAAGAGPGARMVPIRLADAAVADLIRAGDVVDVLAGAADTAAGTPRVVATDAVVVLVPPAGARAMGADGRILLVALPAPAAQRVAATSLTDALTVTLH